MNRVLFIAFIVPSICSIIVNDPPDKDFRHYSYSYDIDDPTTGDTKSQHEIRTGDVVSGSYSVLDPDGTKRTVKYTADPRSGFKAVVHTVPVVTHLGGHVPEADVDNYVPTNEAHAFQLQYPVKYVPQRFYTRVILPPTSFADVEKPTLSIPYYPAPEQAPQMTYFNPTQDRKMILRNSLGPDRYFEPSPNYHQ